MKVTEVMEETNYFGIFHAYPSGDHALNFWAALAVQFCKAVSAI